MKEKLGKKKEELSLTELEKLPWYDLLAYIGLESYNWGGMATWDAMMTLCNYKGPNKILMVGCNVGTASLYLCEKYGFDVVGIDLAEEAINQANEKAKNKGLSDKVKFKVCDAQDLSFNDNEFDGIFTEYMAYFLDLQIALKGFFRVLKKGGFVGFNELMKLPSVDEKSDKKINEAEMLFGLCAEIPFKIQKTTEFKHACNEAGFTKIKFIISKKGLTIKDGLNMIGGWKDIYSMVRKLLKIIKSGKVRQKFIQQSKIKRILMNNFKTKKFVKATQCVAQKP